MATLEKIRSKAGLLVAVVGIALLAFIVGDFLRSGSTFFHQSKEKVVVVDGESVSIQKYQAKVEEMSEVYKRRSNTNSLNEETQNQIREAVFNNLVNSLLLEEQTKEIGVTVGKEELADMIIGDNISPMILQMPDFQNPQTRMFDKNLLLQFLQTIETEDLSTYPAETRSQIESAKQYWLFWEQNIKEQKLESKYSTLLANAVGVNSLEAKAAFEENKISVGFNFVVEDYRSVPDDQVTVSDSEIEKLYNKRKENYKQEPGKVVSYIAVDIVPSKEDRLAVEKILSDIKSEFSAPEADVLNIVNENSDVKYQDAYLTSSELSPNAKAFIENANINDVEGPVLSGDSYSMYKLVSKTVASDSVKFSQLMLPNINDDAKLKVLTDSLIGVLKGGKPFSMLAQEATNGQSSGDMGWMTESQLVVATDPKFKDEVFNAQEGQIFVAKSTYGSHLVQIVGKTKPATKYKVAMIQVAVTPSTETYNKLYNDLNAYVSKNHTLDAFKSSAAEAGYQIQNEVTLTQNQPTLADIRSSRPAIRWAFDHDKGTVSEIFECQDRFVVVGVEGSLKKGFRSLASVSDILKRELINDKKAEKIISDLKAKNPTSFEQYATAMNATPNSVNFVTFGTPNISGIGVEPIINAQAPLAEVGKVTGPLKGKVGVFVLNITSKNASDVPYDQATQKQSMEAANSYRMYSVMSVLKEKSNVEDNRIRFY